MHDATNYAFSAEEKRTVGKTGQWAKLLGFALCAQALVKLQNIAESPFNTIISVGLALAIAGSFITAGNTLRSIAKTEGTDIPLLMLGYQQLTRAFALRIAIVLVGFVLIFLAMLFILLA